MDRVLAHAQEQAALLASLEREMARSKEYLTKVRISLRSVGSELLLLHVFHWREYDVSHHSSFINHP